MSTTPGLSGHSGHDFVRPFIMTGGRTRAEAWIDQLRSRTVTFGYQILRLKPDGSEECLATATTTLVALDEYCHQDSLAMVRIWEHLLDLVTR